MNIKIRISAFIIILIVIATINQSCEKEEETKNSLPTCSIVSPINNQIFSKGEPITISVEAIDKDGSIEEVLFVIDDIEVAKDSIAPFSYEWTTLDEDIGPHSVLVTSFDNLGGSSSDEVIVELFVDSVITGTFTDPRDGKTYLTVVIGDQTWFAENLNYETSNSWWYDNDSFNGDIYGRLYTWEAALTVCPSGWRLPSDDNWKTLEMELGMSEDEVNFLGGWLGTDEGLKMKSTSGWKDDGNGNNSSGFNAIPAGYRHGIDETFNQLGYQVGWWTSTDDDIIALMRILTSEHDDVGHGSDRKTFGISVRCIKE